MTFLNRLFGRKPNLLILDAFVRPHTSAELRGMIEKHPELLTDYAEGVLGTMSYGEKDDDARQLIESRRALLNRCREIGVETAFSEKKGAVRTSGYDRAERANEALMAFAKAETPEEMQRVIKKNPDLLAPEMDIILERLKQEADRRGDRAASIVFVEHRAILRRCREFGVEGAFTGEIERAMSLGSHQLDLLLDELDDLGMRDIPRRIQLCQQALGLTNPKLNPILWADLQTDLGNSYAQSLINDKAENIERAIESFQLALQVQALQTEPSAWVKATIGMANAYQDRTIGDPGENCEQALLLYRQVLDNLDPQSTPYEWANTVTNMAHALTRRTHGDPEKNFQQAIEYCDRARRMLPLQTHPHEWAMITNAMAIAYDERVQGLRAENIRQAIDLYKQALQVSIRQTWPYDWAAIMQNLGNAYAQWGWGDHAQNIGQAVDCYKQALEVRTRQSSPFEWAETKMNLGNAYREHMLGDRALHLKLACESYEDALQIITHQFMPNWAIIIVNLASAHKDLFDLEEANARRENSFDYMDTKEIDQAINLYQKAQQVLTSRSQPVFWAKLMHNLGNAHVTRARGVQAAKDIALAIDSYQQALQVLTHQTMPIEWALTTAALGSAYSWVYELNKKTEPAKSREYLERAIATYNQALEILQPDLFPDVCRRVASDLGNLCSRSRHWTEAVAAYRIAMQATENVYQASLLSISKELALTPTLYPNACYALARAEQWQEAIGTLELGRARTLNEALERDHAGLEAIRSKGKEGEDAYSYYQQAANEVRNAEIAAARVIEFEIVKDQLPRNDLWKQASVARTNLKKAIERIRSISPDFLVPRSIDKIIRDIADAVRSNQPLVYILATQNGGLAFIIYRIGLSEQAKISVLWLDKLYEYESVRVPLNHWRSCYATWKDSPPEDELAALKKWGQVTSDITHQLWNSIMEQLMIALRQIEADQAVLIPTGLLGLLPLHAAWNLAQDGSRRYALDEIAFAYAPSASVLKRVQEWADTVEDKQLFAVGNPDGSLPHSETEIAAVAEYFSYPPPWLAPGKQATYNTVEHALPKCDVYHFACHAKGDELNPLESRLDLFGKTFTARDVLGLKLNARLAFLSACDTGTIGKVLPDEVKGLPTAFIQAGTAGVISTLWRVEDESTALLAERFYSNWKTYQMNPLAALVAAQRWLRDEADGGKWAHPYYWAAFTLTGV